MLVKLHPFLPVAASDLSHSTECGPWSPEVKHCPPHPGQGLRSATILRTTSPAARHVSRRRGPGSSRSASARGRPGGQPVSESDTAPPEARGWPDAIPPVQPGLSHQRTAGVTSGSVPPARRGCPIGTRPVPATQHRPSNLYVTSQAWRLARARHQPESDNAPPASDDSESRRLDPYTYLSAPEQLGYLAIMRLFCRAFLADMAVPDVMTECAREARRPPGSTPTPSRRGRSNW